MRENKTKSVIDHASTVFGSVDKAEEWLHSEQRGLGYARPIDLLETDVGLTAVNNLLGRIERGVYT